MNQEQFYKEACATAAMARIQADTPELPQCCGTGCAVCVLDYPELFAQTPVDSEMLAMIEAVEQAQLQANMPQANQLLTETDGELQ